MEIYIVYILIPEWECPTVLAKSDTPTSTQTLIHKYVPANTECWGMGCDITDTDPGYDSDLK